MSGNQPAADAGATPVPAADPLLRLARMLRQNGYQFTTITPASHARINRRPENRWAQSLEDVFGWSRPFQRELLPAEMLECMQSAGVLGTSEEGSRSLVRLSSLGEDLFLHSAFPTTSQDAVFLGPDTYKFVDAIRAHLAARSTPIRRAVDLCTGAGPGGLAIARAVPGSETLLVDINQAALQLTARNVALAELGHARPRLSDLLSGVAGDFDLIVAHPPYLVDRGSRLYRDGGGPLGADLSLAIVKHGTPRLNPGGSLLLFTGVAIVGGEDPFRAAIQALLDHTELSWSYREVDVDVFGEELDWPPYDRADRIALVVLTVTRHG